MNNELEEANENQLYTKLRSFQILKSIMKKKIRQDNGRESHRVRWRLEQSKSSLRKQ